MDETGEPGSVLIPKVYDIVGPHIYFSDRLGAAVVEWHKQRNLIEGGLE